MNIYQDIYLTVKKLIDEWNDLKRENDTLIRRSKKITENAEELLFQHQQMMTLVEKITEENEALRRTVLKLSSGKELD